MSVLIVIRLAGHRRGEVWFSIVEDLCEGSYKKGNASVPEVPVWRVPRRPVGVQRGSLILQLWP
jgi:hypothetical protein